MSKCDAESPALEAEYKVEVKVEGSGTDLKPNQAMDVDVKTISAGILLKPNQEVMAKSAAQIVNDQHGK